MNGTGTLRGDSLNMAFSWRAVATVLALLPSPSPGPAEGLAFILEPHVAYQADSRLVDGTVHRIPADIGPVRGPLEATTRDVLAALGARLVDTADAPSAARLEVRARALALGQFYDRSESGQRIRAWHYAGARFTGTLGVVTPEGRRCDADFDGTAPLPDYPLKTFGYDPREDPVLAPFQAALVAPGGYADVLAPLAAWLMNPDGGEAGPRCGVRPPRKGA